MFYMVIDWLIEIAEPFELRIKTLVSTIDLFERCLANFPNIIRDDLQLLAMICLDLSAKMFEIYAPELDKYVFISDQQYTLEQIKRKELDVIRDLNYIVAS